MFDALGLPGSQRTPRILANRVVSVPASQEITLDPARFRNDSKLPLFLTRFALWVGTTENAALSSVYTRFNLPAIAPKQGMVHHVAVSDLPNGRALNSCTLCEWQFKRPFMVLPGESVSVQVLNLYTSALNVSVGLFGFTESRPAPQKMRYVPAALYNQTIALSGALTTEIPEAGMSNDGAPMLLDENVLAIRDVTESSTTDTETASGGGLHVMTIRAFGYDAMIAPVATHGISPRGVARTYPEGMLLPGLSRIPPGGAMSARVDWYAALTADTRISWAVFGAKELPL